eukprot:gnl/MRDRNA2_/MRDRNA2_35097_c0_seq2.p1 gnl/MRDRNA2_/MRDRNA2_35097_c0~~gnl/MRDRNA2_/MRDRNA2_35097_c0_seq2.p1  ORF type:complete len:346 (+),score=62.85 gnl/MRDRNA2_/MRDRNA2_35097_c0_seq2:74-1111(+)
MQRAKAGSSRPSPVVRSRVGKAAAPNGTPPPRSENPIGQTGDGALECKELADPPPATSSPYGNRRGPSSWSKRLPTQRTPSGSPRPSPRQSPKVTPRSSSVAGGRPPVLQTDEDAERSLPATVARCRELERIEAQLEVEIDQAEREAEAAQNELIRAREEHAQTVASLRARIAEARQRNSQVRRPVDGEGTGNVVITPRAGASYAAQGTAQMELAMREKSVAEARSRLAKVQLSAPTVASSLPLYRQQSQDEDQGRGQDRRVQGAPFLHRVVTKVPATVVLQPSPVTPPVVLQPGIPPLPRTPSHSVISKPVMSPAAPAPPLLGTGYPTPDRRISQAGSPRLIPS